MYIEENIKLKRSFC